MLMESGERIVLKKIALEKVERSFQLFSKEKQGGSMEFVFISVLMVFLIGNWGGNELKSIDSSLSCSWSGRRSVEFKLASVGLGKVGGGISFFAKSLGKGAFLNKKWLMLSNLFIFYSEC